MIDKKRLLDTFLEYVQIDSESGNEKAMAERIEKDLTEIGCKAFYDNAGEVAACNTGNLYCTLEGDANLEPMILSAHLDTVKPGNGIMPVVRDGVIYSKGDTILAADDKSGVAAIVEVLRTLKEKNINHPTIEAIFTIREEGGVVGSANLQYEKIKSKKAFVLDSSGAPGAVITAAPGQVKINVTIHGKAAHAGICPEEGVSAIMVAADAISNMQLLRIDEETTANIGTAKADFATNIVPDTMVLIAEARSIDNKKLDKQGEHMLQCIKTSCEKYNATFSGGITKSYDGYKINPEDKIISEIKTACDKCGLNMQLNSTGGGSDANHFNVHGIKAVPLGTGMDKVHSNHENIKVSHLEEITQLVLALATK